MALTVEDSRPLWSVALRIGAIVAAGFLLAHLLDTAIGGLGIDLLYGIEPTLLAIVRNTALLTALVYAIANAVSSDVSQRGATTE